MATTIRSEAPAVPLGEVSVDTLTKVFFSALDRYRGTDAMLYESGGEWRPLSHAEVATRVERVAAGLHSLGVGRGDRVGILSENRPEWAIADFAVLCLGAADVPIYATLPPGQVGYILRDSGAKVVLLSNAEQLAKIDEVRSQLPALEVIISFAPDASGDGVVTLDQLLAKGDAAIGDGSFPGTRALAASIERDDLATLIYTSGTTGDPKGVMLTHFNIASNVAATSKHGIFDLHPGFIALSFLPLSHSFERMVDYYYWWSGVTIAYVAAIDKVGESMLAVKPHVIAAAPRVFEKIYARVMGATGLKLKLVLGSSGNRGLWFTAGLILPRIPSPMRNQSTGRVPSSMISPRRRRGRGGKTLQYPSNS